VKLFIPIFALFLLLPGVVEGGSNDYIVFRVNISPLYIENESLPIQVLGILFKENRPVSETLIIRIEIDGMNVPTGYALNESVRSGDLRMVYLPPLPEGHYKATVYAERGYIRSEIVKQDFAVTKPPIPYKASFTPDGSRFIFKSMKRNETGRIDPNYPFTLHFYLYRHGEGEVLVRAITNFTDGEVKIPKSWRTGVLYVDVVDVYGWRNSATIDLSEMRFSGIPESYDYLYTQREPYKSRQWTYYVPILLLLLVFFYIANRLKGGIS